MRRLLLVLTGLVLGLSCLVGTGPANAGDCQYVADCYGPPASVRADGPATVTLGQRRATTVSVATRGSTPPRGTITISYTHPSGTSLVAVRKYQGEPITVRGPRLEIRGRWKVTVTFTRADNDPGDRTVNTVRVTRR